MELRIEIDDTKICEMTSALGVNAVAVNAEALTILYWIIQERKSGKSIYSAKPDGGDVTRLSTKNIDYIQ